MSSSTEFSAEEYFRTQPAPPTLERDVQGVQEFLQFHSAKGNRVVLVTSGGTTVPLEKNVVRFLDNFSAGTRGATSAEYFLKAGYAVIFMHRQFSLQPFSRHYSHTTNPFLDILYLAPSSDNNDGTQHDQVLIKSEGLDFLTQVLRARQDALSHRKLQTLTFVTVNEYLFLLRAISGEMSRLKRSSMYYLAAAVSDFFLPTQKMSEHKIQSRKGSLHIEMDQVPKILQPMVADWTPESFVVSFKLETDPSILIPKAQASLERYGHQVVIGNTLHTRKFEVIFIYSSRVAPPSGSAPPDPLTQASSELTSKFREEWVRLPGTWERGDKGGTTADTEGANIEIEELIVNKLVDLHTRWLLEAGPTAGKTL